MWSFFSSDPTKQFPFDVGEKVEGLENKSIWTLHHGKRKADGQDVSVFVFDIKTSKETFVQTAKTAHKRLKTLRHPNILLYIDGLETESVIYVVTESVTPLQSYLKSNPSNDKAIAWGLHQLVKGLSFLHNDCKLKHNNVNIGSVFVDKAGEWKMAGVDYMGPAEGDGSNPPNKGLASLEIYDPPEMSESMRARKKTHTWSADMWGLGCLIWEVYNGSLPRTSALKALGKIPKTLVPNYCELVGANPISRPNPARFIEHCRNPGGFMENSFVETNLFLEEIQFKDQTEKNKFFARFSTSMDEFPKEFCQYRILPLLLQAFEFSDTGSAILNPLLKLGKLLGEDEYQKKIVPCVIKMFSSTDRATRIKLLQQMGSFIEHLNAPIVNDQIFPNICHGFNDTNPVIREHTVKAMLMLASKLNDKNLNVELLRHFAKLQSRDEQGGIRTNTTVCLGKIAHLLNPTTRQKVLSSAFVRAMKDPFPPARTAGVMATLATQKFYTLKDCASRVLPTLCTLTVDPDKGVRDCTFKTIKAFLDKLHKVSENPELAEEIEAEVNSASNNSEATGSGWAGWAMSSITSRIYKPGAQPTKPGAGADATKDKSESSTPEHQPGIEEIDAKKPERRQPEMKTKEERDSASDYEGDGNGGGWGDNDDWGDIDDSVSNASSKTSKSRESHKDSAAENAGWDNPEWEDNDEWGAMEDTAPPPPKQPQASMHKTGTNKGSSSSRTSTAAMKLGGKKKPEPDFGFDDWGSDNSWGLDAGGSTKSNTSRTSKSSSSSVGRTSNPASKPSAKKEKPNMDVGGWDDMADWGDMDGDGLKAEETQDTSGGGWGDDDGDWGAMEDTAPEPVAPSKPAGPPPPGWDTNLEYSKDTSNAPASSYNWGDDTSTADDFLAADSKKPTSIGSSKPKATHTATSKPKAKPAASKVTSGWDVGDDGWGATDDSWGTQGNELGSTGADQGLSKTELAKKQREEKRRQREKEIREKRAARKTAGSMKLGMKKGD